MEEEDSENIQAQNSKYSNSLCLILFHVENHLRKKSKSASKRKTSNSEAKVSNGPKTEPLAQENDHLL